MPEDYLISTVLKGYNFLIKIIEMRLIVSYMTLIQHNNCCISRLPPNWRFKN